MIENQTIVGGSGNDTELDIKQTNTTYPRVNNESVLEFVFPPHPNLFLRKNKIAIRGTIELSENYIPDNGIASKVRLCVCFLCLYILAFFNANCTSSQSNCHFKQK